MLIPHRQKRSTNSQSHHLEVKHGQLRLKTFGVELPPGARLGNVAVKLGGRLAAAKLAQSGSSVELTFEEKLLLDQNSVLEVSITLAV